MSCSGVSLNRCQNVPEIKFIREINLRLIAFVLSQHGFKMQLFVSRMLPRSREIRLNTSLLLGSCRLSIRETPCSGPPVSMNSAF